MMIRSFACTISICIVLTYTVTAQIDILENGNIGIGTLNPLYKLHMIGPVHATGNFTIGSGGNGILNVRHINGKSHHNNNSGGLFLNWHSRAPVYIGGSGAGDLVVGGTTYSTWFRARGATGIFFQSYGGGIRMMDNVWIRIYGGKSIYQNTGIFRTDGNLQVGPQGKRFVVKSNKVGINEIDPVFTLEVDGTAGKTGGGEWATLSDKKVKKNITKFDDGLEQVLQINPVTFQYNGKGGVKNTEKRYVGVIAQEIQKVAPYTVDKLKYTKTEEYEDDGKLKNRALSTEEFLQFDGTAIQYMLVNAIKEQQAIIEKLKTKINALGSTSAATTEEEKREINLEYSQQDIPALYQNTPNPTSGRTTIAYYLPETAHSARLLFFAQDGTIIKEDLLTAKGYNELFLNTDLLSSGMFFYSLEVDGKKIDQKTFVVAK